MYLKTEGLVLRQTDYKDTDRILNVLTREHGKMTFRARGVRSRRSKLGSACQLLCYSEFTVFENRGSAVIDEAVPLQMFPALRQDLTLLSLASYFAQVAEVVAQEDCPNPALLSLCLNAMYVLGQKPQALVKAAFELRCACLAGYAPMLEQCPVCGSEAPDRFHLSAGGVVCAGCQSPEGVRVPLTPGMLAAMRYLAACPPARLFSFRLGENDLQALSDLTERYLMTQFERSFHTLDFYKSLLEQSCQNYTKNP